MTVPHVFKRGRGRPTPQSPCAVCGISKHKHPVHDPREMQDPRDLLTLSQVAAKLQCSVRHLKTLIEQGEILCLQLKPDAPVKKLERVERKELWRFLDELEARALEGG